MSHTLKPIKPKRIADQVFDQLHDLILRGMFKPGEKIMTERELSEAFQVSRTSVRDAINKLVVMGMLEQRQGQGTFVSRPGGKTHAYMTKVMESQNATMQDLLEVRMGLECNAAAMAAQRALDSDIEFLEQSLKEMEDAVQAGRLGSDADTQFHMAIAYATHNPLQVFIMKQFHDFLAYGIKENLFRLYRESRQFETIQQQHTQIMKAIKDRDAMRAYMATKRHIEYVIQTVAEGEMRVARL
ncbi:MAG: FadR/GntR family transcriptional regulator [Desulfobacteraceae bacterium]|jgi:GntR family transcriptional repressor for pyruvate dehydrogenase complex